jgi:TRAP-type C4-dicarboxylate transport system permease small subunit
VARWLSFGWSAAHFAAVTVPRLLLGLLVFLGIGINFANVIARYVFSAPIVWAEEVLSLIMIWCVFIGAIVVAWDGRHIKMDLISARLRSPWREIINTVTLVGIILVCVFVILQSYTVVSLFYMTGQRTIIARLPAAPMHASVLIGFIGILLVSLVRWRSYVFGELGSDAEATTEQAIGTYGSVDDDTADPVGGAR